MEKKNNQNEKLIENNFIRELEKIGYTYRSDIKTKLDLENNFRIKFNRLNGVNLTDKEFERLKEQIINKDVFVASTQLRTIDRFNREDDTPLFFKLVNIDKWCQNDFEVVNQISINTYNSHHRYDALILINGIPMVQIEFKNNVTNTKVAMEQIVAYKNDKGNGYTNSLLCFIQLFIVSNEHTTLYFANNLDKHFQFNQDERFLPIYKHADRENNKICNIYDFTKTFLQKCSLAELISKYMVLVKHDSKILIMRPYQIYAVETIIDCINENRGNGYIWHTTGSGKTLTSFKAATLLKENNNIYKCLFVVDRKDLDSQTRDEFNKFQTGCVEENTNTASLVEKLLSEDKKDKIIVTTIQKLGIALGNDTINSKSDDKKRPNPYKEQLQTLKDKRFVFIFDECHRSQFGANHEAIKTFFPNSQLFGFTGTPIFEENATQTIITGTEERLATTESIFQTLLHKYTITNAIGDENVLKFHIEYFIVENTEDKKPNKLQLKKTIVKSILSRHYALTSKRRFNAFFATSCINDAIEYYNLFKEMQEDDEYINRKLNIACVFSPPAENNKDIEQLQDDLIQEKEDYKEQPQEKKSALIKIIDDYNKQYGTNYNINMFYNYYKDIQTRIKNQQHPNKDYKHNEKIDIVIVVDMLLTGFDSKYLNTLYVDKNLKYHHLIQAFSRTNRVLNNTKPHGNIVDFRNQEKEVNKAVILFSGVDKEEQAQNIWLVEPSNKVIEKYKNAVNELKKFMEHKNLDFTPSEVNNLIGEKDKLSFINYFREVQHIKTILDQYTDIPEDELKEIESIIPTKDLQGFRGAYLGLVQEIKEKNNNTNTNQDNEVKEDNSIDDIDFDLALFSSAIIDYDYIMDLIYQYASSNNKSEEMTKEELIAIMRSTSNLIEESETLIKYVEGLEINTTLNKQDIEKEYKEFKESYLKNKVKNIAEIVGVDDESLQLFVKNICIRLRIESDELNKLKWNKELNWKERAKKETELLGQLAPLLKDCVNGKEINGLSAYEK